MSRLLQLQFHRVWVLTRQLIRWHWTIMTISSLLIDVIDFNRSNLNLIKLKLRMMDYNGRGAARLPG